MDGQITNIVPISTEEQTVVESTSEDREKYSEQLAQDHLAFMEEEFAKDAVPNFWKILKAECERRLGGTEVPNLMDAKQQKSFGQQILPWGKYAGTKVVTVLKKDRESLERMAKKPLPFQIQLSRFLASVEVKSPEKKSSKTT